MSNDAQRESLDMALRYHMGSGISPNEVVKTARVFEDYLRGDRNYNDRLNLVINEAVEIAKDYQAGATAEKRIPELTRRVKEVIQLPPDPSTVVVVPK